MNLLFPKAPSNDYKFPKIILYIFVVLTAITLGRSLIHMFASDGGANTIASIITFEGTPDPNQVIYMIFSLWGLSQLLMGIWYVIVIARYKTLIPLMYGFIAVEYIMRIVVGRIKPLSDVYFAHVAPGVIGNYLFPPLAIVLMIWALRGERASR